MQQLPFIKMHGAENDYIFFDGFASALPNNPEKLAPEICDRHAGIGADGIITMAPPSASCHDVEMRIWNADGSTAEMCGNGARCIAVWMKREGRVSDACRIKTVSRIVTAQDILCDGSGGIATVAMGRADLVSSVAGEQIAVADDHFVTVHRVNVGNPHAVLFVDSLNDAHIEDLGRHIEHHSGITGGTNVEFVEQLNESTFQARVWERGSGETRSCGSGACAIAAAAVQTRRLSPEQSCVIRMPGGELQTVLDSMGDVLLTGPVKVVCNGRIDITFNCD